MDIKFQDRIDDYLLGRMSDADKEAFLQEVEQDDEKKEQLEFTKQVKDSIRSREEKLRALTQFQQQYAYEKAAAMRPTGTGGDTCCQAAPAIPEKTPVQSKNRAWLWITGIAALFIVGFFAVRPVFMESTSPGIDGMPMERMRGGNEVFEVPVPADSIGNDSIVNDTTTFETPYE